MFSITRYYCCSCITVVGFDLVAEVVHDIVGAVLTIVEVIVVVLYSLLL